MFVERNKRKEITGAYAVPQVGKKLEFLEESDKELMEFLESIRP